LNKENLLKEKFFKLEKIGYILSKSVKKWDNLKREKCACIIHNGETKMIWDSYSRLLTYIKENQMEISGNSREYFEDLIINSKGQKGHMIKICIPIL